MRGNVWDGGGEDGRMGAKKFHMREVLGSPGNKPEGWRESGGRTRSRMIREIGRKGGESKEEYTFFVSEVLFLLKGA